MQLKYQQCWCFAVSGAPQYAPGIRTKPGLLRRKVAIPRQMFQEILRLIAELRPQPPPAPHEAFDCHAFKRNRQEECVQMPEKIATSAPRPPFGPPVVPVAARTSRLASREAKNRCYSHQFGSHLGESGTKSISD
jgi:hypothetical protein